MNTPPSSSKKKIAVRALRRIKDVALAEDLDWFSIDQGCVNVDMMCILGIESSGAHPSPDC